MAQVAYILTDGIKGANPSNKYIDGLMQKRRNSVANAMQLRRFCTEPTIYIHI